MAKRILIYSVLMLFEMVALSPAFGAGLANDLDAMSYGREGKANFVMHKNLEGEIKISSSKENKTPRKINLLDLDTDAPSVIFEGGYGAKMPFRTVFEDAESLVIKQQAGSSMDVITINKKTGVLVRMASGVLGGTYVVAEKGQLN